MNTIILSGRLVKDVEVRYTSGDEPKAVARFTLAVDDGYGESKKTYFPGIVAFGKPAENLERYCKKGSKVLVRGKIVTGSYEKDGKKVYTTNIVADNFGGIEFLDTKSSGSAEEPVAEPDFTELRDDDIPF